MTDREGSLGFTLRGRGEIQRVRGGRHRDGQSLGIKIKSNFKRKNENRHCPIVSNKVESYKCMFTLESGFGNVERKGWGADEADADTLVLVLTAPF